VSASEDACPYSCRLAVHTMYEFFYCEFETLEVRCLPRSSALPNTLDMRLLCDGADRPAATARP
jgi:hypothetical protein